MQPSKSVDSTEKISGREMVSWALLTAWCSLPGLLPTLGGRGNTVSITDILGICTLGAFFLFSMAGRIKVTSIQILLALYSASAILSVLAVLSDTIFGSSLMRAIRLLFIVSPVFLFSFVEINSEKLGKLVRIYVTTNILGMLFALVAYYLGVDAAIANQTINYGYGGLTGRAGGWVGDSSAFGHQVGTVTALLCLLLLTTKNRGALVNLAAAGALLVGLYGLYATSSRSALVNIAITLLAFFVFVRSGARSRFHILLKLAIFALFVYGVVVFSVSSNLIQGSNDLLERMIAPFLFSYQGGDLSAGRFDNWQIIRKIIENNWFAGIGYSTLYSQYGIPADNFYLKSLAEVGVMGSIFGISGFLLIGKKIHRKMRKFNPAIVGFCLFSGQFGYAFFVDIFTFFSSMPSVLTILMAFSRVTTRNSSLRD